MVGSDGSQDPLPTGSRFWTAFHQPPLPKGSSISIGGGDEAVFGLKPDGANAPVLYTDGLAHGDTGPSEHLGILSLRLSMTRRTPLIRDADWHDAAGKRPPRAPKP